MNDNAGHDGDALAQAARWRATLGTLPVSADTLKAFFAWRRIPGNDEAFETVEALDTRTRHLAGRPAIEVATRSAWARGGMRSRRSCRSLRAIAICAGIVATVGILWSQWLIDRESFATGIGQRREIVLRDGSTVMLDTDTRLSIRFSSGARDVRLEQGQAFFTVAHDKARPFTVRAGEDVVVATGTQFDVRHEGEATLVALVRGGVDVRSDGDTAGHLTPGQQWRESKDVAPIIETVALDRIAAWTHGRVDLDHAPLGDAIAEVNRYLNRHVVLDAEDHAHERISGSLRAGDAHYFVVAVTAILPLVAVTDGEGAIHLRDRPAGRSGAI